MQNASRVVDGRCLVKMSIIPQITRNTAYPFFRDSDPFKSLSLRHRQTVFLEQTIVIEPDKTAHEVL